MMIIDTEKIGEFDQFMIEFIINIKQKAIQRLFERIKLDKAFEFGATAEEIYRSALYTKDQCREDIRKSFYNACLKLWIKEALINGVLEIEDDRYIINEVQK